MTSAADKWHDVLDRLSRSKPMRAVIYARYSSDAQSAASIEDQVEVCRRYAERQGWQLARVYEDRAISGASAARPGYQALLADAERGLFDVIVVEALDRLGRKLADVAALHDRLEFRRIALHAVNMGVVTTMHVGLLGTMAQLYLSDLKDKTRRGQLGRVLQGRAAGGRAYGYRTVEGETGRAGSTRPRRGGRRIFELFAAGVSPRAIARQLNAEGVPGPDGRPWQDTTIRGQAERGTGILNNELYAGQLVWNRCSYVKDPRSGRRLARPNPPEQWERIAVPELRIVDDALWQAVKRRQAGLAFAVGAGRRRERAQPRPPAPLPALGPAGLRRVRRRLHDHGQGSLWLRRAPQQGHLRQRPDDQPAGDRGPGARRAQAPAAGARPVRGVRAFLPGGVQPPGSGRGRRSGGAGGQACAGRAQDRARSFGRSRTASTSPR